MARRPPCGVSGRQTFERVTKAIEPAEPPKEPKDPLDTETLRPEGGLHSHGPVRYRNLKRRPLAERFWYVLAKPLVWLSVAGLPPARPCRSPLK